jgi:hypothetical protein
VNDAAAFALLRVLHQESGALVDRTISQDFPTRTICAQTDSLSPFVIASAPSPKAQFSASAFVASEETGFVLIEVSRLGDTSQAASVDYSTSDGTAMQKSDYELAVGTIEFAPGEVNKPITILLVDNSFADGARTVNLTLSNPIGIPLGSPSTAVLAINDNDGSTGPNPVDVAGFYVRQHYYDFLNRLPDPSGLDFWTHQITDCGADAACIEVKRINVSGAYFLSIEFQETGYLVYRFYNASLNRNAGLPRYLEFLRDTQEIGRGVIVGATGWEAKLESNKVAFAAKFTQQGEFVTLYPTTQTPAQFVDSLFVHAQITPTSSERSAAIAEFGSATNTVDTAARGRVLRRVAENATVRQREFNRAFVLMQYFGYLRRNPNDAPDTDFSGYDFWLNKLNQFNGNFVNAEMVKAFLVSTEYRHRFGP